MSTSLLTCGRCGTKNRLTLGGPSVKRSRCGKCKHEFTPRELAKAVVERPAAPQFTESNEDFDLEPTEDIEWECPDGTCGWYGAAEDANTDANKLTCPSCGTKLEKAKDVE